MSSTPPIRSVDPAKGLVPLPDHSANASVLFLEKPTIALFPQAWAVVKRQEEIHVAPVAHLWQKLLSESVLPGPEHIRRMSDHSADSAPVAGYSNARVAYNCGLYPVDQR